MAKLSIVMCVYNTAEYLLKESLDSIFSAIEKDIELIFVDDGSTKDYSNLIKKYDKIVYYKTENQGILNSRIFGVKKATAPYVCFADSDDTMSELYYSAMLKKAEQTNADIVLNDWSFHTDNCKYYCKNDTTISNDICYQGNTILEKFMEHQGLQHTFYVLWNKIFKRELLLLALAEIDKLNIGRMLFAEDMLIMFFVCTLAKKMVNTHIGFYFYRIHALQQTSSNSKQQLIHHITSQTLVFDTMETKLKELGCYDEYEDYFINWKKLMCFNHYSYAKGVRDQDIIELIKVKYKLGGLIKNFWRMDKFYANQIVLPQNLTEVDLALKKVYYSNKHLMIYAKKRSYGYKQLSRIITLFSKRVTFVKDKKNAMLIMPKERVPLKLKIMHNNVVCKIGMLLFPKGSKIRKILKSKL